MSETVNPYDDEVVDPYEGDDVVNPHEGGAGPAPADEPEPADDADPKPAAKARKATKKK
jgi:hypothetical protein